MEPSALNLHFTSAACETAALLSALDWSVSPIGDPANWPPCLKTVVGIVLRSRNPMCVWWGPSLINIYNDDYIPLLGKKHPQSLGKPVTEPWPGASREILSSLKNQVLEKGRAVSYSNILLQTDYNGLQKHSHYNFSYSPIIDDNGEPGGLLCICNENNYKPVDTETEQLYEKLIQESSVAFSIFRGENFVIESANHAMLEKIWRKELAEVQGSCLSDVFPELASQQFTRILGQVLKTGVRHREEQCLVCIHHTEGKREFYLDLEYTPLLDKDGLLSAVMVVAHDVSEKTRYIKLLEETEEKSRLAIEATELATYTWDLESKQLTFSDRLAHIFGFADRQGLHHSDLINAIHPLDRPVRDRAVTESLKTGSLHYQVRLIWPDKTIHWVSIFGKIEYDANRVPVKMFGTALDITNQKNFQIALQESEEKFRSLTNFLPQFIWIANAEGDLPYLNRSIIEFSGLSEDELTNGGWMQLVHPDEIKHNMLQWERTKRTGSEFNIEHRLKNKDGEYRWQLSRAVPLGNNKGEIQTWIGSSTDIHDQKMMAEELERRVELRTRELKQANEELIRTNQELEQFAYVSSHDLQEPLRKIQTFSDLVIKKMDPMDFDTRLYLEKIIGSANRMSILINDLLNYSRISKSNEGFVAINLNRVMSNILNDFEVLIRQKGAVIHASDLPVIRGIPIQINQLFYNLISNALKFANENPVINVTARLIDGNSLPETIPLPTDKQYTELVFADNGIGFDQMYATQIFTIFQRLNNRKHYSGTGIGLAICKKIAENHHGYITAKGTANKGAEFIVYLAES
jgi:PAS domain S-box-containing protein